MAIFIDPPMWPAHHTLWSHLISDSNYEELHEFARLLRIPRRGFDLDHYDVPAARYEDALELGALAISPKEVVHRLQQAELRVKQIDRARIAPARRRAYLRAEWSRLGASLGGETLRQEQQWLRIGDELLQRWNEPHRRYHDERHLEDVLLALDHLHLRDEAIGTETLLAAWFHDAVYQGTETDELDSADFAAQSLELIRLGSTISHTVAEMIVATRPGHEAMHVERPLAQLLDADLSIFGAAPARYRQYAQAVRAEYAHVPEEEFRERRAMILTGYLSNHELYRTPAARELWQDRARVNLAQEIKTLRGNTKFYASR